MKKIAIISGDLSMGGTSRSLVAFIDKLINQFGVEKIDLYCFKCEGSLASLIPNEVQLKEIPSKFISINNLKLRRIIEMTYSFEFYNSIKGRIKRNFNRGANTVDSIRRDSQLYSIKHSKIYQAIPDEYDIAISWTELLPMYFLTTKVNAQRKLAWIHPNYIEACFDKNIDETYLSKLDFIVTVSKSNKEALRNTFPTFRNKIITIYNCFNEDEIILDSQKKIDKKYEFDKNHLQFISVCRLHDQSKAIFRALEICNNLKKLGYKFTWFFIGEGPDKKIAQTKIKDYGLQEYVFLLGEKNNPYKYVRKMDVFILQSYYEGKPMAVDEALILGKPVLITDYSSAEEQVINDFNGFIVKNNKDDIQNKLIKILNNPLILNEMKNNIQDKRLILQDDLSIIESLVKEEK